mgnify:FL=1
MMSIEKNILFDVSKKYGLPVYVYDKNKIISQYSKLRNAFINIDNLHINYAAKALSNINILNIMKDVGCGIDAVSIQEVELALYVGFKTDQIFYTPSGVELSEIKKALKLGVQINIDNISALKKIAENLSSVKLGIRINPNVRAGGNSKISVGDSESKFGLNTSEIQEAKKIISENNISINGLHIHTGSDIEDINSFLKACDFVFEQAEGFKELEFLDFGSGFKVKYFENDSETDVIELGKRLGDKFLKFNTKRKNKVRMHIEPGKFLVSECGYFLTKVNYVNNRTNKNFIHVNSGLNHFVRPMFYGSKHAIENISSNSEEIKNYSVVGYICETDTFSENVKLKKTQEGDILCFKNAGAYCFSMSSNYNSRFKPPEVLVSNNEIKLIRKRENFKDLIRNQSN